MISKSLKETEKIVEDFLVRLQDTHVDTSRALVIGLFGDLGSGKTTFTQILGKKLGVEEVMTSPTFVIQKNYLLAKKNNFKNLIHIDAYRLESSEELKTLGFTEILKDPTNLILIEWPERVEGILPTNLFKINFKFISEFEREILYI